jgi:hypothetical protein
VQHAVARVGLSAGIADDLVPIAAQRAQHLEVERTRGSGTRARLELEARNLADARDDRARLGPLDPTRKKLLSGIHRGPRLPDGWRRQRRTDRLPCESQPNDK